MSQICDNCPLRVKSADLSMLFKPCQVVYNDNVWYNRQITGFEFNEDSKWMFKISFPDGETTIVASDDPEVKTISK